MSGGKGDKNDFSTTLWSVVLEAQHEDDAKAQAALEKLCNHYWYPVYAFLRRSGRSVHESEDLTQAFFHFLLARRAFQTVSRERGRFRSFLLTALTNFLHNERDREQALKRGGGHEIIPLDEAIAESFYCRHQTTETSPQRHFDQSWALLLIQRALDELREDYNLRGRLTLFAGLQPFLTGEPVASDYECLALRLGMETATVKVALHRARRRFGELLRREIARTVTRPEEIEEEIRHLLAVIAG